MLSRDELEYAIKWRDQGRSQQEVSAALKKRRRGGIVQGVTDFTIGAVESIPSAAYGIYDMGKDLDNIGDSQKKIQEAKGGLAKTGATLSFAKSFLGLPIAPFSWALDKAIGKDTAKKINRNINFDKESRGNDAAIGHLGGDIAQYFIPGMLASKMAKGVSSAGVATKTLSATTKAIKTAENVNTSIKGAEKISSAKKIIDWYAKNRASKKFVDRFKAELVPNVTSDLAIGSAQSRGAEEEYNMAADAGIGVLASVLIAMSPFKKMKKFFGAKGADLGKEGIERFAEQTSKIVKGTVSGPAGDAPKVFPEKRLREAAKSLKQANVESNAHSESAKRANLRSLEALAFGSKGATPEESELLKASLLVNSGPFEKAEDVFREVYELFGKRVTRDKNSMRMAEDLVKASSAKRSYNVDGVSFDSFAATQDKRMAMDFLMDRASFSSAAVQRETLATMVSQKGPNSIQYYKDYLLKKKEDIYRKFGIHGNELANKTKVYDKNKLNFSLYTHNLTDNVLRKAAELKINSERFVRLYDSGNTDKFTDAEKSFSKIYRTYTETLKKFTEEVGGVYHNTVENYFPRVIKPEVLDDILNETNTKRYLKALELANGGGLAVSHQAEIALKNLKELGAKRGGYEQGFEKVRKQGLVLPSEWMEMDMELVLKHHATEVADRVAFSNVFGKKGEGIFRELAHMSGEPLEKGSYYLGLAAKSVEQLINRVPTARWLKNTKAFETNKIAFSAFKQFGDMVVSATQDGFFLTLKNSLSMLANPSAIKRSVDAGGGLDVSLHSKYGIDKTQKWVKRWFDAIGFTKMQAWQDRIVVKNGIDKLENIWKTMKKSKTTNNLLVNQLYEILGTTKNVTEFMNAKSLSEIKKFDKLAGTSNLLKLRPIGSSSVPLAWDSNAPISLVLQFRRFEYNLSTVLYREIVQKFKDGDRKGATRSLATFVTTAYVTGAMGEVSQDKAKAMVKGLANLAINGEYKEPEEEKEVLSLFGRVVHNINEAGGAGYLSGFYGNVMYGARSDHFLEALAGPAISDVSKLGMTIFGTTTEEMEKAKQKKEEKGIDIPYGKIAAKVGQELLAPIPYLGQIIRHVNKKEEKETIRSLAKKERATNGSKQEGSVMKSFLNLVGGLLPKPTSEKGKGIIEAKKLIDQNVKDITAAQTFSIMAGAKPGEVVLSGEGAETAGKYLTGGYGKWLEVSRVIDGDTIEFTDGSSVRLLGSDTPEISHGGHGQDMQGGREAKYFTEQLAPKGSQIYSVPDEIAGDKGKYGRDLRYLYNKDGVDINKEIVEGGYGRATKEYDGERYDEFASASPKETSPTRKSSGLLTRVFDRVSSNEGSSRSVSRLPGEDFHNYGSFQMNRGTATNFAKEMGFKNTNPETKAFAKEWRKAVKKDPEGFLSAERKSIAKSHLEKQTKKMVSAGISVELLKDESFLTMVLDTAVNNGANTSIIVNALKGKPNISPQEAVELVRQARIDFIKGHSYEKALTERYKKL